MRLTLLAVATETGLGYQTRDYYKHLSPHKTVIIDISSINGLEQHYEWYQNAHLINGIPKDDELEGILSDTDVLLTAETPYNLNLYKKARQMGVKTVCVENPEFYDHMKYPDYEMPDLIILPSVWLEDEITRHATMRGCQVVQLHHPVDRGVFKFKLREHQKPIHIAGKPAAHDRNGTWDYLRAIPNGVLITQSAEMAKRVQMRYRECRLYTNVKDNVQMYELGDILVFPRRYGGNCLPLNEALSSGMPVIMPDISPNNHLLPKNWLIPAYITDHFYPRTKIDIYSVNPEDLREKVEWVKSNISSQSKIADQIADSISWETLKPRWLETLENL